MPPEHLRYGLDLRRLLAEEMEKRQRQIETGEARMAIHSLRGSAALAGETELALVVAHLGMRMRSDPSVAAELLQILEGARARLAEGEPAFSTRWPEPPPGLAPSAVEPRYRADYFAAMRDRLAELDATLAGDLAPRAALDLALGHVHAMKGAAGSVGDDSMSWYCHGLESRLKALLAQQAGEEEAVRELPRHHALLALLLEEPTQALETLRGLSPSGGSTRPTGTPASRPPHGADDDDSSDAPVRVPGASIDRLLERLDRIDLAHEELAGTADSARQLALRLREVRTGLLEALRLIGPPRPWGAPARAIERIEQAARHVAGAADNADHGAATCRRTAEALGARVGEMRAEMATLRRTTLGWLFSRVRHGVERFAQGEGRLVRLDIEFSELPLDRGLAERLLDPLLQLARNAVAHGIQPPEQRAREGKPPVGLVSLRAERLGDWLAISVEDDGRGVDAEQIRKLAIERGALSPAAAERAGVDDLLSLLFLPGLSTRRDADLLAGRGVGLDLARESVRRLGGAIRLTSRPGSGLRATLEVPAERGLVDLLWVSAAGSELGLPVSFTGRLRPSAEAEPVVELAHCLGLPSMRKPSLAVELVMAGVQPIAIGVDAIGAVEQASVRALPPLIAAAGPYSGAVLRGDGSLRLTVDAALLAARAWAALG
jgi:two-component system, chemotaxis family, sensor kinase CheA